MTSVGTVDNSYERLQSYQENTRFPKNRKVNFDESSDISPNTFKNINKISNFSPVQRDDKSSDKSSDKSRDKNRDKSSRIVSKTIAIRGKMKHKKLKCSASNSPILTPISATVSLQPLGEYSV